MVKQWLVDPEMSNFLRPETLYGKKFEGYLNEVTINQVNAIKPKPKFQTADERRIENNKKIFNRALEETENGTERVKYLLKAGATITIIGWIWGFLFPINKQLWTSSYVLFTGGLAIMILAICIFFIDIKGFNKLAHPFVIFGTNSIFLFTASGLWVKTILKIKFILNEKTVSGYTYLYQTVFHPLAGDLNGSLLFALSNVGMWWLILYWMYRKKIFIKI